MFGCEYGAIVDPPGDLDLLDRFLPAFLGHEFLMCLVAAFAVPGVHADFLSVLVLGRTFGEPKIYPSMVGVASAGSLGQEILAVGLVYVMEGLVGAFAILGVHSFVDVAGNLLPVF